MADALRIKWDRASRTYDWLTGSDEARFGAAKSALFRSMSGRVLMLAAGTGADFRHFPAGLRITALDISAGMLAKAKAPALAYEGLLTLVQADARRLPFPDGSFDTILTVGTFCSVPEPLRGLQELHRVLTRGGRLLLFEHVRSRMAPIALMQDLMTPLTRRFGPDMNRDTLGNVQRAGFRIVRETNIYLDVVKAAEAVSVSP